MPGLNDKERLFNALVRRRSTIRCDRHQAAIRFEDPPRSLQRLTTDRIENNVKTRSAAKIIAGVVDHIVHAQTFHKRDG